MRGLLYFHKLSNKIFKKSSWCCYRLRLHIIPDSCNVLIYNQSNLIQTLLHPKNLTGALKFGVYCLYQHYKTFYRFDYTEKKGKQCVCRINAWIEADKGTIDFNKPWGYDAKIFCPYPLNI